MFQLTSYSLAKFKKFLVADKTHLASWMACQGNYIHVSLVFVLFSFCTIFQTLAWKLQVASSCQVPQICSSGALSAPLRMAHTPRRTWLQRGSGGGRGETTEGFSQSEFIGSMLVQKSNPRSYSQNQGSKISVISRGVGGMGAWHNCSFHFHFRGIYRNSTLSHPPHPPTNPLDQAARLQDIWAKDAEDLHAFNPTLTPMLTTCKNPPQ